MELAIWEAEQGAALHSAAFGAELFVMLCRISSQEGAIKAPHPCLPLWNIFSFSWSQKLTSRWEWLPLCRSTLWLKSWRQYKAEPKSIWMVEFEKEATYWKRWHWEQNASSLEDRLYGAWLTRWGALDLHACFSHSPTLCRYLKVSFHQWRILFFFLFCFAEF